MNMLIELLYRIFTFDISWLVNLFMGNLFFVFGFTALMYYFMNGKKVLFATIILTLVLYAVQDFEAIANVVIIAPAFMLFHYIGKLGVHILAEQSPSLKKYHLLITNLELIAVFFLFNIFMRG